MFFLHLAFFSFLISSSDPLAISDQLVSLINSHSKTLSNAQSEPLVLPSLHFFSEPISLQNGIHSIVGSENTQLTLFDLSAQSGLFSLTNDSLSLKSVGFVPFKDTKLVSLSSNSAADLISIHILMSDVRNSLFNIDEGQLSFSDLHLDGIDHSVSPLVSCSSKKSSISFKDSSLQSFETTGIAGIRIFFASIKFW